MELVVVRLLWLSGRAPAAQARGVLGSTPSDCRPFHFPLFRLITSKFLKLLEVQLLSGSCRIKVTL